MKLKHLSEGKLLSSIRKEFSGSSPGLTLGIGDDGAVIKSKDANLILTKDLMIEDVHFIASLHPPYLLGRKSLSINLSDIAAMGGEAEYAILGLGLSSRIRPEWIENYFSGFKSAAKKWGVTLVGGDVSQSKKIVISVTVVGKSKKIIRRSGGKPGHILCVSGDLGDAKQGLLLLKKGFKLKDNKKADPLLHAFLDPVPQLDLAQELSRLMLPSSMIDISDGLSIDLFNLCKESGCGAEIIKKALPLSPGLFFWQRRPYDLALHGGEDYQLLFSVPPKKMEILDKLQGRFKITCIGKMIQEKGMYEIDPQGRRKKLTLRGYQHFGARPS